MAKRFVLALLVTPLLLAACTTFAPPREDARNTWGIDPAMPGPEGRLSAEATFHVARPAAAATVASTEMAYQQADFQRQYYARNRWAAEPAQLLHPHLVAAIESAGLFTTVIARSTTAPAHYRLETELLELMHDFRAREQGRVRVRLRAHVIDLRRGAVVATRRFRVQADSAEASPQAGVAATNDAIERVLVELTDWLAEGVGTGLGSGADRVHTPNRGR